ncbi:helix-turn-helix transcriptional regulator [Catellatospora sp. KI3]|uniref:helix-turn-helix domain-containing protein n=1 Tax=Catellatospora sp. KI3 TaxID=3041620 RepID=UPI002482C821|nr:helix-turn-helix transcriptional regulator [Catellatospora sp. KI3]MDI1461844.1 helix-turn-helix transcriptional regulator [Catellatospora sp. KI3]
MTSQPDPADSTTFVGTEAVQDRIARLRGRRGAAERVDGIRAEMAEADRVYAENLAAVRKAADLTQVELAKAMGVAQSEISRIESRPDMLLSTLAGYLAAAGDRPRVVVTIAGHDVEMDLTPLIKR